MSKESEKLRNTDNIFSLAETLREKSLYLQALRNFEKALKGYSGLQDNNGIFNTLLALGDTHRMTGGFDRAVKRYSGCNRACHEYKEPRPGGGCNGRHGSFIEGAGRLERRP